jgi:hypothetical protein
MTHNTASRVNEVGHLIFSIFDFQFKIRNRQSKIYGLAIANVKTAVDNLRILTDKEM